MTDSNVDLTECAREIVENTGVNLFLTGKAGTGKTTFLHSLCNSTRKRHIVLAPTGVAAINAGGVTIHSFFQLSFAPFLPGSAIKSATNINRFRKDKIKIIRGLDLIIIDEISMVRPDVLDAMDRVLRHFRNPFRPFGGVQLLLIGDLRQLAPVAREEEWSLLSDHYASPYFFESHALKESGFLMLELTKVYRQSDSYFINILNMIRDNRIDEDSLAQLNQRANPTLRPASDKGMVHLTTHNYSADNLNNTRLAALSNKSVFFEASISGNFPESSYPVAKTLELKQGAQVMFTKNDISGEHLYYNGLIGEISSIANDCIIVTPRGEDATPIQVERTIWENMKYELTPEGEIKEVCEGSFQQFPLRLAWAITIHKSQGLTFDKAIIDASHSFAPGQAYVALSRCSSLDGLYLSSPIPLHAIKTDYAVNNFISSQPRLNGDVKEVEQFTAAYYSQLLFELFDFSEVDTTFDAWFRAAMDGLSAFPNFCNTLNEMRPKMRSEIIDVAFTMQKFLRFNLPNFKDPEVKAKIDAKVKSGSTYFRDKINPILKLLKATPFNNIDDKRDKKRLIDAVEILNLVLTTKWELFKTFSTTEFSPQEYLECKAKLILSSAYAPSSLKTPARRKFSIAAQLATTAKNKTPHNDKAESDKLPEKSLTTKASAGNNFADPVSDDILNPQLYYLLKRWRTQEAGARPAYTICTNATLIAIANRIPKSPEELMTIKGIGKVKFENYGSQILEVVKNYLDSVH